MDSSVLPAEASSTADFILQMNDLFDCLNSIKASHFRAQNANHTDEQDYQIQSTTRLEEMDWDMVFLQPNQKVDYFVNALPERLGAYNYQHPEGCGELLRMWISVRVHPTPRSGLFGGELV